MRAFAAAVGLSAMLLLAGTAAAGKPPAKGTQALKIVQALIAKEQAACGLTWKHMTAQGLTMDGPPWRVTVTGVATTKGSGTAIWMLTSVKKPANALAKTISSGCR